MPHAARAALGSLLGAALAACAAPLIRPFFGVPSGGVGFVTVNAYPKSWDYMVLALLVIGAFVGGFVANRENAIVVERANVLRWWPVAVVVFIVMLFVHDHPYQPMDHFHEGEHLAPAFLLKSGEHPY